MPLTAKTFICTVLTWEKTCIQNLCCVQKLIYILVWKKVATLKQPSQAAADTVPNLHPSGANSDAPSSRCFAADLVFSF